MLPYERQFCIDMLITQNIVGQLWYRAQPHTPGSRYRLVYCAVPLRVHSSATYTSGTHRGDITVGDIPPRAVKA